jgi:hypothetical protein
MIAKKILGCARALVVLLAITMGFVISMSRKPTEAPTISQPVRPVNLDQVNAKLDRILEEGRARDTVLLQQLLKLQQHAQGGSRGIIAESFSELKLDY